MVVFFDFVIVKNLDFSFHIREGLDDEFTHFFFADSRRTFILLLPIHHSKHFFQIGFVHMLNLFVHFGELTPNVLLESGEFKVFIFGRLTHR